MQSTSSIATPPPPPPPAAPVVSAVGGGGGGAQLSDGVQLNNWRQQKKEEERREAERSFSHFEVALKESAAYDSSGSAGVAWVDWESVTGCQTSEGGAGGVAFVELQEGQKVVLKGSTEPARECFTTRLARLMNIAAPSVRPVSFAEPEYKQIKQHVWKATGTWDNTANYGRRIATNRLLSKPNLLIMEFISGRSLYQMRPEDIDVLFSAEREIGRRVLRGIGKVAALDVCLNNWDRLPLLHDNDGNFGNILIQDDGRVVSIDNGMTPITPEVSGKPNLRYDKYLKRVEKFCVALVQSGLKEEPKLFANFRQRFLEGTGVPLKPEASLPMMRGAARILCRFSRFSADAFATEKQRIEGLIKADWQNVWGRDCAMINVDFLETLRRIVAKHCDELEKLLEATKKT